MAVVALKRLGMNSLSHMHFPKTSIMQRFRVVPQAGTRIEFRMPQLHLSGVRIFSQKVEKADAEPKVCDVYEKTRPQTSLNPSEECQAPASAKAQMIKSMMLKGFTLEELLFHFPSELSETNVLHLLLWEPESRKMLIAAAVSKPENALHDRIYELVKTAKSNRLTYEVALDMTRALFSSTHKNTREILQWITLGSSTNNKEDFVKEVLLFKDISLKDQEFDIVGGCVIPRLAKHCWQEKFLRLYKHKVQETVPYDPSVAWALFLKLPFDCSLQDKFIAIPDLDWLHFFKTFQKPEDKNLAYLELKSLLLERTPYFLSQFGKCGDESLNPSHNTKPRNETPVYNGGC